MGAEINLSIFHLFKTEQRIQRLVPVLLYIILHYIYHVNELLLMFLYQIPNKALKDLLPKKSIK